MLRIREAGPDDEAFVVGLVPRFVEHGAADGHTVAEVIDGTVRGLIEALGASRDADAFWIAQDEGGTPVGFVYAVIQRDFFTGEPNLHVSEIAVDRSGAGIGTDLMEAVERLSRPHAQRHRAERVGPALLPPARLRAWPQPPRQAVGLRPLGRPSQILRPTTRDQYRSARRRRWSASRLISCRGGYLRRPG